MTVYCTRIKKGVTAGTGKMAIWEKPATGDRMAPFDDPITNFDLIRFHSDFQYLSNAIGPTTVTVSHASVAGSTGTGYSTPADGGGGGGSTGSIANGQIVTTTHSLLTHSLGYAPLFMVMYNDVIISGGTVVQLTTDKRRIRTVSAYATTTEIRLKEVGISSIDSLPSASVDYKVIVFRDPTAVAGQPLARIALDGIIFGYGKVNSEQRPLRRAAGADVTFYIPISRHLDIRNGAIRSISPIAGTQDFRTYTGGFFAAESIQVTY